MTIFLTTCFISVAHGGYVNINQIHSVEIRHSLEGSEESWVSMGDAYVATGDKTPKDFMKRVEDTCGGKVK